MAGRRCSIEEIEARNRLMAGIASAHPTGDFPPFFVTREEDRHLIRKAAAISRDLRNLDRTVALRLDD